MLDLPVAATRPLREWLGLLCQLPGMFNRLPSQPEPGIATLVLPCEAVDWEGNPFQRRIEGFEACGAGRL